MSGPGFDEATYFEPDPAETLAGAAPGARGIRREITLPAGTSLAAVAEAVYGDPGRWPEIADANSIRDPTRLRPGRRLLIP